MVKVVSNCTKQKYELLFLFQSNYLFPIDRPIFYIKFQFTSIFGKKITYLVFPWLPNDTEFYPFQ